MHCLRHGHCNARHSEQAIGYICEEKALFFALYDSQAQLDDMQRTLTGNMIARVGEAVRSSDRKQAWDRALPTSQEEAAQLAFDSEEEASAYFRVEKQTNMLHALFHWMLAERFDRHAFVIGVRTKGRIVAAKRRY